MPGNEVPEVQDWLLRSKGAERTRREGGKKEKRPGGHKGTGEGRSRGQVKTPEPTGPQCALALGKPTKQSAHPRRVSAACLRGGRLEGDQGGVSPCRPRPAQAGLVTELSCGHLVRSMGAAPQTHTADPHGDVASAAPRGARAAALLLAYVTGHVLACPPPFLRPELKGRGKEARCQPVPRVRKPGVHPDQDAGCRGRGQPVTLSGPRVRVCDTGR